MKQLFVLVGIVLTFSAFGQKRTTVTDRLIANDSFKLARYVDEISNDATLSDADTGALVTEYAIKAYVDSKDVSFTNELQQIDTFIIVGNVLRLSLSSDGEAFHSVDLSAYLDNTDAQTLSFSSPNLSISGGNSVSLSTLLTGYTTGSGTTDRVPVWTSSSALGNSYMLQSASGTTIDANKFLRWTGWTTANRPATPSSGTFGYNTTTNFFEGYHSSAWYPVAPVSGTPTAGHIPFWNASANALDDEAEFQYNTSFNSLGVGTTAPTAATATFLAATLDPAIFNFQASTGRAEFRVIPASTSKSGGYLFYRGSTLYGGVALERTGTQYVVGSNSDVLLWSQLGGVYIATATSSGATATLNFPTTGPPIFYRNTASGANNYAEVWIQNNAQATGDSTQTARLKFKLGDGNARSAGQIKAGKLRNYSTPTLANSYLALGPSSADVDQTAIRMEGTRTAFGGNFSPAYVVDIGNATGGMRWPVGTTAQVPTGANGVTRFNSTEGFYKGYRSASGVFETFATYTGTATTGQIIGFNGTSWAASTLSTSAQFTGNGVSSALTLAQNGATSGQVMGWNGATWGPTTVSSTNIYNTDGTIPANRTATISDGFRLRFTQTEASTSTTGYWQFGEGSSGKVAEEKLITNSGAYFYSIEGSQAGMPIMYYNLADASFTTTLDLQYGEGTTSQIYYRGDLSGSGGVTANYSVSSESNEILQQLYSQGRLRLRGQYTILSGGAAGSAANDSLQVIIEDDRLLIYDKINNRYLAKFLRDDSLTIRAKSLRFAAMTPSNTPGYDVSIASSTGVVSAQQYTSHAVLYSPTGNPTVTASTYKTVTGWATAGLKSTDFTLTDSTATYSGLSGKRFLVVYSVQFTPTITGGDVSPELRVTQNGSVDTPSRVSKTITTALPDFISGQCILSLTSGDVIKLSAGGMDGSIQFSQGSITITQI